MIKHKKNVQTEESAEVNVKLKPFFGIKPLYYVPAGFAAALLLIFFILFINPGIKNYGTIAVFSSQPEGVSVWSNDEYLGTVPFEFFLPAGEHELTFRKNAYPETSRKLELKGRLLFSYFFPLKTKIDVKLEAADSKKITETALAGLNSFSMTSGSDYYMPPLASGAAADLVYSASAEKEELFDFLLAAFMNTANPAMLKDSLRAASLILASTGLTDPSDLSAFLVYLDKKKVLKPELVYWYLNASGKKAAEIKNSSEILDTHSAFIKNYDNSALAVSGRITVKGVNFIGIRPASYIMGAYREHPSIEAYSMKELPHEKKLKAFFLAERETTNREYYQFVSSENFWSKQNTAMLIEKKLADENYLAHWTDDRPAQADLDKPLVFVSWHAAEAYTRWLGKNSGYTVSLPEEAQWEYAAGAVSDFRNSVFRSAGSDGPLAAGRRLPDKNGFYDLLGNVWEWCADSYAASAYFFPAVKTPAAEIKTVRGASWANEEKESSSIQRGKMPASWCTPYTGIRPAAVYGAE
jgi:formylglycine-generating enzyme required for sulfatase activity